MEKRIMESELNLNCRRLLETGSVSIVRLDLSAHLYSETCPIAFDLCVCHSHLPVWLVPIWRCDVATSGSSHDFFLPFHGTYLLAGSPNVHRKAKARWPVVDFLIGSLFVNFLWATVVLFCCRLVSDAEQSCGISDPTPSHVRTNR